MMLENHENTLRGWELRRLGDCLQTLKSGKLAERGWSPQCLAHAVDAADAWGVLKTTAVQAGRYQPQHNKELPSSLAPKYGLEISNGDFLMTTTGPRNRCGVPCLVENTPQRLIFSGKILRFRADESVVLSRYLMYVLISPGVQDTLNQLKVGTSDSSVSIGNQQVLDLKIPVMPLGEQNEIVRILEEQFSRLDAAAASIAAVRRRADHFRRSLLHAAFSGQLLDGSENWTKVPIEELLEVSIGGVWGDGPGESEVDVDVVRVTEMREHGSIDVSTAVRRSVTQKQLESRALRQGDLLLEKSGGGPNTPVGRVGRVTSVERPTVCSNFMQLMRPDSERVLDKFLHHYLVFFHADGKTIPLQTATTNIRNIKTKDYLKCSVPLPAIAEQVVIVETLESRLSHIEAMLALARDVEKEVAALRRSMLHAAFSGELTKEWRDKNNG